MATRLNLIKVFIVFLVTLTICAACKTTSLPRFDYLNGPDAELNAFKDRVFFAILRESYKGTEVMRELDKVEAYNPYDGIHYKVFPIIDSIAFSFARSIPPPFMCDYCTQENRKNYFMAQALHFYRSYELDSIARVHLRRPSKRIQLYKFENKPEYEWERLKLK